MKKYNNERAPDEHKLVTDGKELYLLSPRFILPKGVKEVLTHEGKNVYDKRGRLRHLFVNLQKIQPRNNMTFLTRSIKAALASWQLRAL